MDKEIPMTDGLHDFGPDGNCRNPQCGVSFLDAAGYCPTGAAPTAVGPPEPAGGTVTPGTTGTPGSGQPGTGNQALSADWPELPPGPHRIRCLSDNRTPPGAPDPHAGKWLTAYDPEACGGNGYTCWSADPALAIEFIDALAAWECWQQAPRRCPYDPAPAGGQPNRPLTAWAVELVAVAP